VTTHNLVKLAIMNELNCREESEVDLSQVWCAYRESRFRSGRFSDSRSNFVW